MSRDDDNEIELEEDQVQEKEVPRSSKKAAVQQRLRQLQLQMRQARRLNQQAVRVEAEAHEGKNKKKYYNKEKIDKATRQQADQALSQAQRRQEQAELDQYSSRDYHNPGGQHRNYLANVATLPTASVATPETSNSYDPLADSSSTTKNTRRLAQELQRRIHKRQEQDLKRRTRQEEDSETPHINKRNKAFNQKLARTMDTAEIRQDLERGTAL